MRTLKLNVNTLRTDMTYQSPVKTNEVRKIVNDFNPKALTSIIVSQRRDGEYYIIDGQHRVNALKELSVPMVEALVYTGLSPQDEADMYTKINERKAKSPNALGKAKFQSGDLTAVSIDNCVTKAGLFIDYDNKNKERNHVCAYKALEATHKKYGGDHLTKSLIILKDVFGNHKSSFEGNFIKGMAFFLERYEGELDIKRLYKALGTAGIAEFKRRFVGKKLLFKGTDKPFVAAVIELYNHRLSDDKKINGDKALF